MAVAVLVYLPADPTVLVVVDVLYNPINCRLIRRAMLHSGKPVAMVPVVFCDVRIARVKLPGLRQRRKVPASSLDFAASNLLG